MRNVIVTRGVRVIKRLGVWQGGATSFWLVFLEHNLASLKHFKTHTVCNRKLVINYLKVSIYVVEINSNKLLLSVRKTHHYH